MPTVYDARAEVLISKLSEYLRRSPQLEPPVWAPFVKTGSHAEGLPMNKEWWYTRCASLLRKIYLHGPIGISQLRSDFGGRKAVGFSKAHHRDSGSSILRRCLKQLEEAGYVTKTVKGRVLTGKGMGFVDKTASEVFAEEAKKNPLLAVYG
jgi:small subunit ribosomal protein S19e